MTWFSDTCETLEGLHAAGFDFPDNYFIWDLETCGFSHKKDFIVEVGWGVVRNRQLVDNQGLLLDWTRCPFVDQSYLRYALNRVAEDMRADGRNFPYTYERLRAEGEDPLEVLHSYATLLYQHIEENELLVCHGGWSFDRRMLDGLTDRYLQGYMLPWTENCLFDTGLCEKATMLNRPPYSNDTLDSWFRRISGARTKGIKWNLEKHCVEKYRLAERYTLDQSQSHQGWYDCRCIHYLFETFRGITEQLCGVRSHDPENEGGSSCGDPS